MTLRAKFAQLTLQMQDMEHGLRGSLESKPSTTDVRLIIREEIESLYNRIKDPHPQVAVAGAAVDDEGVPVEIPAMQPDPKCKTQ